MDRSSRALPCSSNCTSSHQNSHTSNNLYWRFRVAVKSKYARSTAISINISHNQRTYHGRHLEAKGWLNMDSRRCRPPAASPVHYSTFASSRIPSYWRSCNHVKPNILLADSYIRHLKVLSSMNPLRFGSWRWSCASFVCTFGKWRWTHLRPSMRLPRTWTECHGIPTCAHIQGLKLKLLLVVPISGHRCRNSGTSHHRLLCGLQYSWGAHGRRPIIFLEMRQVVFSWRHFVPFIISLYHTALRAMYIWKDLILKFYDAHELSNHNSSSAHPHGHTSSLCFSQRLTISLQVITQTLHQLLRLLYYDSLHPSRHFPDTSQGNS